MKKSTLILIIVLAAGAVSLAVLQLFILPNQKKETPATETLPSPTPTEKFPSLPTPTELSRSPKEKLINLLPHQQESFTIEYLASEDVFIVLIKTADLEAGKEEVITWLENQGVTNWEELNILWGGGRRF